MTVPLPTIRWAMGSSQKRRKYRYALADKSGVLRTGLKEPLWGCCPLFNLAHRKRNRETWPISGYPCRFRFQRSNIIIFRIMFLAVSKLSTINLFFVDKFHFCWLPLPWFDPAIMPEPVWHSRGCLLQQSEVADRHLIALPEWVSMTTFKIPSICSIWARFFSTLSSSATTSMQLTGEWSPRDKPRTVPLSIRTIPTFSKNAGSFLIAAKIWMPSRLQQWSRIRFSTSTRHWSADQLPPINGLFSRKFSRK